jgi:hypothetical protein
MHAKKWHKEKFPWHTIFTAVSSYFLPLLPNQHLYIVKNMHIKIYRNYTEIVYELLLLPNDNASEIFLHKSGEVRSVDWIFINGVPAWRRLGKYMTLDIPRGGLYKKYIIILCINYTT